MPLPKKPDSASTTESIKSEDMEALYEKKEDSNQESKLILLMLVFGLKIKFFSFSFQGTPECKVEVTYVVNPSLFFVRKVASKSEFRQLEKDLTKYGYDRQNAEPPVKLELGKSARINRSPFYSFTFFHR